MPPISSLQKQTKFFFDILSYLNHLSTSINCISNVPSVTFYQQKALSPLSNDSGPLKYEKIVKEINILIFNSQKIRVKIP